MVSFLGGEMELKPGINDWALSVADKSDKERLRKKSVKVLDPIYFSFQPTYRRWIGRSIVFIFVHYV